MDLLINAALLQAFLLENVAEFKVPLLVTAQDRDQPGTENAAVRYTIVDGDPGGNFRYQRAAINIFDNQTACRL